MVWSFAYLAIRNLFALVMLLARSDRSKELEILVLCHELTVLRRRTVRPRIDPPDRALLAALSQALPRRVWAAFSVRPETLLRWHRGLVARRWTYPHWQPGRPPLEQPRRELILRLARENPHWGYQRTAGAGCGGSNVLFFLSLATRRVEFIACTANPTGAWATQQARNLTMQLGEQEWPLRLLVHDRDRKFSRAFDDVLRCAGVEVIRTPVQAPNANAFAERWVRTVRNDCLDRIFILGRRHLERVLCVYRKHYN